MVRGALRRGSGGEPHGEALHGGDAAGLSPPAQQRSQPSFGRGLRDERLRALASVGGSRDSRKRRGDDDRVGDVAVFTHAFLSGGRSVCVSTSRTCTRTFHGSAAGGGGATSESREAWDSEERSPPESEERK